MSKIFVVENRGVWMAFSSFDAVTLGVSHYLEMRYGLVGSGSILSWRQVSVPILTSKTYVGTAEVMEGGEMRLAVFTVREVELGTILTIEGTHVFGATQVVTPEWVESVLDGVDTEQAQAIAESASAPVSGWTPPGTSPF